MNLNDLKNFFGLHEKSFVPNVGIGTTTPSGLLDVYGSAGRFQSFPTNGRVVFSSNDNTVVPALNLRNTQDTAGHGVGIHFDLGYGGTSGVAGTVVTSAKISAISENTYTSTASTQDAALQFMTATDGGMTEKMRITSAGNVGVGTSGPGTQLDVVGAITSRPLGTATGNTGQILLRELAASGTDAVTIRARDSFAPYTLTLPVDDGGVGEVLSTDGSGNLSWIAAGGSAVSDGDKGDITVASSGAAWSIDNSSVTLAKMANMSTASFIGRDTVGSGAPEVLSAATAKYILGLDQVENTPLSTWAGSTNITSVGTISTGTWSGTAIAVNKGGTGLTSGTQGGIPYYSSSSAMTSSAALTQYAVVLGGGTGAPTTVSGLGTSTYVLTSNGAGAAPTWQAAAGGSSQWTTAGNHISYVVGAGNVGIGTATTSGRLTVQGDSSTTASFGGTSSPQTQNFTSTNTWTAPAGVTSVTVEVWGGGGGGGGAGTTNGNAGGGGAGGSYAKKVVTVVPGQTYTVTVGTGGAGGVSGANNGTAGNPSWFGAVGTVYAQGGARGNAGASGTGGAGSAASSIGDVVYAGGNGANGSSLDLSGGGGGGAGSTSVGNNAAADIGGLANGTGGAGGNGDDVNANGLPGSTYGGGGGGGYRASSNRAGGAGANGYMKLAWTEVTPIAAPLITAMDSSGNYKFVVNGVGNVGVGVQAPTEKLHVDGNVLATAYLYTSDRRLKTDIVDVAGLELILKMRGVHFRWQKNGQPELGLIAQEVEAVAPDLVVTDPVSGMKSVKYGNIVAPLIQATKELYEKYSMMDDEIQTLKREVASERQKNADLEQRLQRLEKLMGIAK